MSQLDLAACSALSRDRINQQETRNIGRQIDGRWLSCPFESVFLWALLE